MNNVHSRIPKLLSSLQSFSFELIYLHMPQAQLLAHLLYRSLLRCIVLMLLHFRHPMSLHRESISLHLPNAMTSW